MVIYLKYYRCRCLRWFKYKFMYHEKEKAATGLEPVTAKPFLPNPYLDYFDKLEVIFIPSLLVNHKISNHHYQRNGQSYVKLGEC